jgi:hypothetical protein
MFAGLADTAPAALETHRTRRSPEITDQDDVTALTASGQPQIPAVTRPVKVGNQSRLKIRCNNVALGRKWLDGVFGKHRRSAARFGRHNLANDFKGIRAGQHFGEGQDRLASAVSAAQQVGGSP